LEHTLCRSNFLHKIKKKRVLDSSEGDASFLCPFDDSQTI
jgi:hypothetical protein